MFFQNIYKGLITRFILSFTIITGATGTIGKQLVQIILRNTDDYIVCVTRSKLDKDFVHSNRLTEMSCEDFLEETVGEYDVLIHLAFARANKGNEAIGESLRFTELVFSKAVSLEIPKILYISSQGIYGSTPLIRNVAMVVAPSSVYSMAKYAGELLLQECIRQSESKFIILRLDNVIESQNLVRALCKNAIYNHKISLIGGHQVFSYISSFDAANAIFLSYKCQLRENAIYNVGPDRMRVSLIEIGEIIRTIALERGSEIQVSLQEDDTELWAGMDSKQFTEDTGWRPSVGLYDMIKGIYIQTEKTNQGG